MGLRQPSTSRQIESPHERAAGAVRTEGEGTQTKHDYMHPGPLLPALSLARRELVRFLRQRHRVIGALATPSSSGC